MARGSVSGPTYSDLMTITNQMPSRNDNSSFVPDAFSGDWASEAIPSSSRNPIGYGLNSDMPVPASQLQRLEADMQSLTLSSQSIGISLQTVLVEIRELRTCVMQFLSNDVVDFARYHKKTEVAALFKRSLSIFEWVSGDLTEEIAWNRCSAPIDGVNKTEKTKTKCFQYVIVNGVIDHIFIGEQAVQRNVAKVCS
jgi:hypothetical protein